MVSTRLWCRFEVAEPIGQTPSIAIDLSGQSIACKIDGYNIEVVFPETPGGSAKPDVETDAGAYYIFSIEVYTNTNFVLCEKIEVAFKDAFDACAKAASLVVDTCRISQPSTGLAGLLPPLLTARAFVSGEWSNPILFMHYRPKVMVAGWPFPTLSDMQSVLMHQELDTPAVLLAQASNLAMANPNSTNGPAVVLAAIACEMQIKRKILDAATVDQRELLDLLIPQGKPSKFPVADLVKDVTRAMFNRSITVEDPTLFERYQALIKARNTFAHRGVEVDEKEAWAHVVTARDVFAWIDSLP